MKSVKTSRLVEVYNQLSDKPVKKFRDRTTAEERVKDILKQNRMKLTDDGNLVIIDQPSKKVATHPNNEYFVWRRGVLKDFGLKTNTQDYQLMEMNMPSGQRRVLGLPSHDPKKVIAAQKICQQMVAEFTDWARKHYNLPEDFGIRVRFDWRLKRKRSRGGVYSGRFRSYELDGTERMASGGCIFLAMNRHVPVEPSTDKVLWEEYASFADDPDIGNYECKDWEEKLRLLTIHECSHVVQHIATPSKNEYGREDRKGHRKWWKDIYRAARINFGYGG